MKAWDERGEYNWESGAELFPLADWVFTPTVQCESLTTRIL